MTSLTNSFYFPLPYQKFQQKLNRLCNIRTYNKYPLDKIAFSFSRGKFRGLEMGSYDLGFLRENLPSGATEGVFPKMSLSFIYSQRYAPLHKHVFISQFNKFLEAHKVDNLN